MKKIKEHTYGSHIYMELEIGGKVYEVSRYCGTDYSWDHYKTSADGTKDRQMVIDAFNKLY